MLRNDLNGLRVKVPRNDRIYLIDRGKRRWIPNSTVYDKLFRDHNGVVLDINAYEIDEGYPIPDSALIFKCRDSDKWFFLDGIEGQNQTKRWIKSKAVVERYNFVESAERWDLPVHSVPHPDGEDIDMPTNDKGSYIEGSY